MELNVREREGVTIIDVTGSIIKTDALTFLQKGKEVIASSAVGEVKLLLNLREVQMIDSSGLCVIVALLPQTNQKGGRMALLGVSGKIKSLLVLAKLVTLFDRYNDEDEAIASFNQIVNK